MSQPIYIAVVDDHTAFRKGLCLLIELLGDYSVLLDAAGARDCIQQLNATRLPDIILVDIVMQDIDGLDLAAWMKAHYPAVRVLALSALDNEEAIIRMFGAGARGFVRKDVEVSDLRQALRDVMQHGFYCHEATGRAFFRPVIDLAEDEVDFLREVCMGKTDPEIALDLLWPLHEVEAYRDSLFQKLALTTRTGLALYAFYHGIVRV